MIAVLTMDGDDVSVPREHPGAKLDACSWNIIIITKPGMRKKKRKRRKSSGHRVPQAGRTGQTSFPACPTLRWIGDWELLIAGKLAENIICFAEKFIYITVPDCSQEHCSKLQVRTASLRTQKNPTTVRLQGSWESEHISLLIHFCVHVIFSGSSWLIGPFGSNDALKRTQPWLFVHTHARRAAEADRLCSDGMSVLKRNVIW